MPWHDIVHIQPWTHMNASCHATYIEHTDASLTTRLPCDSLMYDMLWHDSLMYDSYRIYINAYIMRDMMHPICVTWLIHMCDMTHTCTTAAYIIRDGWLMHESCHTRLYMRHDSFICVKLIHICMTWRIHMWDVTHSCVTYTSCMPLERGWSRHICNMTHSYVWHDSFISVPWRIHIYDMTHSYVWHGAFTCATRLFDMCGVTHSCMCGITHAYV